MRNLLKSLPLALGLPVLLGMASVGPDDAQSNISKWLDRMGMHAPPHWLSDKVGDKYVYLFCVIVATIYIVAVWGIPALRTRAAIARASFLIDMPIHAAADYIVNDSRSRLRNTPRGLHNEDGVVWVGEEFNDALEQLRQEVGLGHLRAWGRKQIGEPSAQNFDTCLSEIPKTYWEDADFRWLFCKHFSSEPQTCALGGRGAVLPYKQLTLNRSQVMSIWPRKRPWRRLVEKWRPKPRLKATM